MAVATPLPARRPATMSTRARWALRAGATTTALSRVLGFGGGSMIGGRMALLLHPGCLAELTATRRVALVSGTNGKTTTTAMLAAALRTLGPVATNASGANMLDGLTSALAANPAPLVAGEIDEWYLPDAMSQTRPEVVVLLNLSRDQLDRFGEIRQLAHRLRDGADRSTLLVANRDDPYVVHVAGAFPRVRWVGGGGWSPDRSHCPACGHRLHTEPGTWSCRCGLAAPVPHWPVDTHAGRLITPDGHTVPVKLGVPGTVNLGNAAMAIAAANAFGVPVEPAVRAVSEVRHIAGRYATVRTGGHDVRLMLAKNPAGWAATLDLLVTSTGPLVIAVNAAEADGRDTSWLYDVPFERLAGRPVVAAGDRAADLGVRLSYADVPHTTVPDPVHALRSLPEGPVTLIGDYTSFHRAHRRLRAAAHA